MGKIIVKLGEIAFVKKGKRPPILVEEKIDGYIPYLDIEAFEKRILKQYTDGEKCSICEEGDIVIVWDGSRSGLVERSRERGAVGSTIARLIAPNINKNYLYYFLKGKYLILNTATKGTGTPHVDPAILWNFEFPIVSMEMQNRIVEKIEELFSELDKAKEELQKVREQLKIYRQSILKAAFEGKLTDLGSFNFFSFGEVCEINPSKKEISNIDVDIKVTFLPMSLLSTSGTMLSGEARQLRNVIKGYTYFRNGDVLLAKITPCFENGKRAIARELKNGIGFGSTEFHVLRPRDKVISEWLFYGISLEDFRNGAISQMTGTAGQKRVPKRIIENYKIPVPEKIIQKKIVNEIESRLSVCDKIEESVESGLIKIEHLRQSILKKAFEGKLVLQDPKDLPAEELLKQIKIEKEKIQNNSKKKVKR